MTARRPKHRPDRRDQTAPQGDSQTGRKRRKQPLYQAISDALRRRLAEGNPEGGARLPSLRELAGEFRVSTITVRQALRSLEEEGQLHCIPGVGVFVRPSIPGRQQAKRTTLTFVTIDIENAYESRIAHYIEAECQDRGWSLQLVNAQGSARLEARNLAMLAESGATGAIIMPTGDPENFEALVKLKLSGFPFVLIDRFIPGLKVDVVQSDHMKGAYLATEYLLRHGHRRVLMVVNKEPTTTSVEARIRGYEQALTDHGTEPLREWKIWIELLPEEKQDRERRRWLAAYHAAVPVLRRLTPPIAAFCHNAYSGWGLFEACRELKLHIPRDVSLVCFEIAEFTRAFSPPMTAVGQRAQEIARTAVDVLDRRIAGGDTSDPQQILIDVDLIERESVATVDAR